MSDYLKIQSNKILACYSDSYILEFDDFLEKGRNPAIVGEIRQFSGRSFQKQANGKWKELTEGNIGVKKDEVSVKSSPLDDSDKKSILGYTGKGYMKINSSIRKGEVSEDVQVEIDNLNKALDKLPDFSGVVNRFLPFYKGSAEDHLDDFLKGDIIKLPEFTSTTKLSVAPGTISSNDIKIEIKSKTGKDITNYSEYKEEQEVLFKTDSIFEVESVKIVKYKSGFLKGKPMNIIVKLKEL